MTDWEALAAVLRSAGYTLVDDPPRSVGGGDISAAWRVVTDRGLLFVKSGGRDAADMFAAEAAGLGELGSADAVRVPAVAATGAVGDQCFLALEWLSLSLPDAAVDRSFGRLLVALHKVRAETHGWHRDNTIGRTPQRNTRTSSWTEFFGRQRLGVQLELATERGRRGELKSLGERVLKMLPDLLDGHDPQPSLCHGDLWSGNYASCDGQPVIYDPAVYFGDRETDLAMTRLFGGFSETFYQAYQDAWPLPSGHERRLPLYQLYHALNHVNLFGDGYLPLCVKLLRAALH